MSRHGGILGDWGGGRVVALLSSLKGDGVRIRVLVGEWLIIGPWRLREELHGLCWSRVFVALLIIEVVCMIGGQTSHGSHRRWTVWVAEGWLRFLLCQHCRMIRMDGQEVVHFLCDDKGWWHY